MDYFIYAKGLQKFANSSQNSKSVKKKKMFKNIDYLNSLIKGNIIKQKLEKTKRKKI